MPADGAEFRRQIVVSDAVFEKLQTYHDLLLKWQKAINLVSPSTISTAWSRHFLDSAQITPLIPQNAIIADLGCGAGFPGLVLAILRPDLSVHLVESDERKGQFLRTISRETQTKNVTVHTKRIEDVTGDFVPTVVTARALASLEMLLEYTQDWAVENPDLRMVFLKGKAAAEEIERVKEKCDFEMETQLSQTDSDGAILILHNVRKR